MTDPRRVLRAVGAPRAENDRAVGDCGTAMLERVYGRGRQQGGTWLTDEGRWVSRPGSENVRVASPGTVKRIGDGHRRGVAQPRALCPEARGRVGGAVCFCARRVQSTGSARSDGRRERQCHTLRYELAVSVIGLRPRSLIFQI